MKIAVVFVVLLVTILPTLPLVMEGDGTLRGRVQAFLHYALGAVSLILSLLTLFLDEVDARGGDFFAYVGLPRDASWGQFRRRYDRDGEPDISRAGADMAGYAPIAAHLPARGVAVLAEGAGHG